MDAASGADLARDGRAPRRAAGRSGSARAARGVGAGGGVAAAASAAAGAPLGPS